MEKLERFFSTKEIESDRKLIAIYVIFCFGYITSIVSHYFLPTFSSKITASAFWSCPAYFESCEKLFFLNTTPDGYSHGIFLALYFTVFVSSLYFAYKRNWGLSLLFLNFSFFFETFYTFFLTEDTSIPISGYLIFPTFIFLYCRNKLANLRLLFVFLYSMAGLVKLHDGWIAGTYFSSIRIGLPLMPLFVVPLATNLVTFMELVGAWWLLSKNDLLRKTAFWFFVFFHFYSAILVGPTYPLRALPLLVILFQESRNTKPVYSRLAWVFLSLLLLCNVRPFFYPDSKSSFEGTELAFVMFDGNRQTISKEKITYADGTVREELFQNGNSYARVRPHTKWFRLRRRCERENIKSIEWTLDQSLNGGPFRRIIDVEDACKINYDLFHHNEWIHVDGPIVGFPDYNYYSSNFELIEGQRPEASGALVNPTQKIQISSTAQFLSNHTTLFSACYVLLALVSAFFAIAG